MKKNELIIIEGKSVADMSQELCRRASLADMIRKKCGDGDPLIALKPNLVGPIPASDGATTHPEIVEAVLSFLGGRQDFRFAAGDRVWGTVPADGCSFLGSSGGQRGRYRNCWHGSEYL